MNTQADLQRWSDDVARDPRSLAFLPLAKAYRRQGLTEAAMQLCLRGLEHHPANIEAHGLLALLYLEQGDRERAADEWSMVLRMDPDNFEALRGMGFCYLEKDQLARARQMLERAARLRPADAMVREALKLLGTRTDAPDTARRNDPLFRDDPWAAHAHAARPEHGQEHGPEYAAPVVTAAPDADAVATAEPDEPWSAAPVAEPSGEPAVFELVDVAEETQHDVAAESAGGDPLHLFDELLASGPLFGAVVVDAQGLVHAGRFIEQTAVEADVIGAVVGGSVEEAARTVQHLHIGAWRGILLEAEHALLHLAPVSRDAVVVLAAQRNTPAGWLKRVGAQAAERAGRYLEAYE